MFVLFRARFAHAVKRYVRACCFAIGALVITAMPLAIDAAPHERPAVQRPASGRLVESNGAPVANVTVTASNGAGPGMTAVDGTFEISGAAGATLTFTRDGVVVAAYRDAGAGIIVTLQPPLRTIGRTAVANASTTAAGQVTTTSETGLLGARSIYTTPYSVGGFTETLIDQTQARSLSDVVTSDSSIRVVANAYGDTELLSIRGFDYLPGATLFEGLPGLVNVTRPPLDGIERVDIVKGPSALLDNDSRFERRRWVDELHSEARDGPAE